jgi:hypothetical protein
MQTVWPAATEAIRFSALPPVFSPGGTGMMKVKFTAEEDGILGRLVREFGTKNWKQVAQLMRTRNARQCRERWNNYINPALRMGTWTPDEDELLLKQYAIHGSKWSKIAKVFRRRSDLSLRNRWQMLERRRLQAVPISSIEINVQPQPQNHNQGDAVAPENPFDELLKISEAEFDLFDEIETKVEPFFWH